MGKEMNIALNLIQAYEVSRKHGILVLRGFDFECDELEFMTSIVFDCLRKNISTDQIYEILNNYEDVKITQNKLMSRILLMLKRN